MTAGKGFADVVYIPIHPGDTKTPAIVIELKRNGTAESGIAQIKEKRYFDCLSSYRGKMLLVGINYDENDKTHECRIESIEK